MKAENVQIKVHQMLKPVVEVCNHIDGEEIKRMYTEQHVSVNGKTVLGFTVSYIECSHDDDHPVIFVKAWTKTDSLIDSWDMPKVEKYKHRMSREEFAELIKKDGLGKFDGFAEYLDEDGYHTGQIIRPTEIEEWDGKYNEVDWNKS